ncbi:MAG: HPr kinase/phosphatase C-terminal domain-containing protein [Rhodospirillaceae bacterium]|nr:HPr kinase/phosphatase C-terminal domain-containing protein [Rhodospirillaceae bacterium]
MENIHATCVCVDGDGVLIRGRPGAGKSDLALRLIDGGAKLVSDDYTEINNDDGNLMAHAPGTISGLIEVRALGVVRVGAKKYTNIRLIVELTPRDQIERLPERLNETLAGVSVAVLKLDPFDASAPAKVRLAVRATRENLWVEPEMPGRGKTDERADDE